jgi:hypothetical protein
MSKNSNKKPPRTVHIDVYCTGSDADTSSNSSSPNIVDNLSNLIAQHATLVDTEDMFLHHRKVVSKSELPRKIKGNLKRDLVFFFMNIFIQ